MKFLVKCGDRYYRDTRKESGHGGFSDILTSSTDRGYATRYESREAALAWAAEFLPGHTIQIVED